MITPKWDKRFMGLAKSVSIWSKDKRTGVGAVIVNDNKKVISLGFNGFPRGVEDDVESRHQKPEKDYYVTHAERNALDEAETSLVGATIYCTFFTCATCAHGIIQKGLKKVVAPEPNWEDDRYSDSQKAALKMYEEAGVEVQYYQIDDNNLMAFWDIGCGGGKVHSVITEDKFLSYIDSYKKDLESKGHKVQRYMINDKINVVEFFVGKKEKHYLYFGKYEVNDFIFKR